MTVEVGQVWRDEDKRTSGRCLWIIEVADGYARYAPAFPDGDWYRRGVPLRGVNNRIAVRRLRRPRFTLLEPTP